MLNFVCFRKKLSLNTNRWKLVQTFNFCICLTYLGPKNNTSSIPVWLYNSNNVNITQKANNYLWTMRSFYLFEPFFMLKTPRFFQTFYAYFIFLLSCRGHSAMINLQVTQHRLSFKNYLLICSSAFFRSYKEDWPICIFFMAIWISNAYPHLWKN